MAAGAQFPAGPGTKMMIHFLQSHPFQLAAAFILGLLVGRVIRPDHRLAQLKQRTAKTERLAKLSPQRKATIDEQLRLMTPDVVAAVRELARAGQVIPAIRLVRTHTGMGLRDAKELVENMPE